MSLKDIPGWFLGLILLGLSIILLYVFYQISAGSVFVTPWGHFGLAKKGFVPANLDWTEATVVDKKFDTKCEYRWTIRGEPSGVVRQFMTTVMGVATTAKGLVIYASLVQESFVQSKGVYLSFDVSSRSVEPGSGLGTGRIFEPGYSQISAGSEDVAIKIEQRCPAIEK
jgi:hypothetical protein